MKKIATLLFSIAALFSSNMLMAQPSYPSYPPADHSYNQIHWLRSYPEAVALSQAISKPIVILFTGTEWCPACMKLERTVLTRPEFAQAVGQKFVFLKAEFSNSESAVMASPYKPLIDRYRINAFPTIVIVNVNGQMLHRIDDLEGGPQTYAQELLKNLNR